MFSSLKQKVSSLFKGKQHRDSHYISPTVIDTEVAIHELSNLAHTESDAIELYIALASLYRVQGDIEKALQIHSRLLVRSDITQSVKARLYAELGKDYKRAGLLDRAIASYKQAQDLGYASETFFYDMVDVYDMLGEYEKASALARSIKDSLTEGYYIVKQKIQHRALVPLSKQEIRRVLEIAPELIQAWVLLLSLSSTPDNMDEFRSIFIQALNYSPLPFLLFELYITSSTYQNMSIDEKKTIVETIAALLQEYKKDFLLLYYMGVLYRSIGERTLAIHAFQESAVLKEDFWATQYELFTLTLPASQNDTPFTQATQFFLNTGKTINRFVCSICALQVNSAFSLCPRCKHIQSISFRTSL